jgi:hypothetical protein
MYNVQVDASVSNISALAPINDWKAAAKEPDRVKMSIDPGIIKGRSPHLIQKLFPESNDRRMHQHVPISYKNRKSTLLNGNPAKSVLHMRSLSTLVITLL